MTTMPLFQPDVRWELPRLSELPSWAGASRVGIDVETWDPELKKLGPGVRRGAKLVGISFAIEDGPSAYLPIGHRGGDNLDRDQVLRYLRDQAQTFTNTIVGANLQYDLDFLAEVGVVFRQAQWFRDVQVADPLIWELHDSYALDTLAQRWGLPGKDETLLQEASSAWHVHPKQDIHELPARFVAGYAEQDARLPLQILRRQERVIDEQDLWPVYNLESQVLPILIKMRRRGVRIDLERLEGIEAWSKKEEKKQLDLVYAETGVRIKVGDVWRAEVLAAALERCGIKLGRTAKTDQPKVDKMLFAQVNHPVAKALDRARRVNKLRTTFASSVRNHLVRDRIHCTFHQLRRTDDGSGADKGARYGRLSSSDPNLQQQPSRDDFASMWRAIYVPDDGGLWASLDYSQQEPRMLAHFAELARCQGAEAACDRYRSDPTTDNHTMMARIIYGYPDDEEPSKKHRTDAKIIFLGLCYGMGGAKLARSLGLPTKWIQNRAGKQIEVAGDEAQSVLDLFDRRVPFVRQLAKMCEAKAARVGFIRTIGGRRCRFPAKKEGGYDWCHKALNRLIQGSSADQTKMAMVQAEAAGIRLQLQIHDEFNLTVASPDEAERLAEIMRTCTPLQVPSRVDVEVGPSWGEAK